MPFVEVIHGKPDGVPVIHVIFGSVEILRALLFYCSAAKGHVVIMSKRYSFHG